MENVNLLLNGLSIALSMDNFTAAVVGAVIGLIVGAMPGIGSLSGVALLMPLTFKMDPTTAVIMLAALYYSNMYGGSFSAILLNIPGDSPAVMTCLDGYPMARHGKGGKALNISTYSSFVGGTIGIVVLTFLGPALADWGLAFGPAELTWLIIFALTSIGWMLGDKPSKGLLSTAIGMMIATIGVDKALGQPRFSFGIVDLFSGIDFIPLVIGMFGFGQVIDMVANRNDYKNTEYKHITIRESWLTMKETIRIMPASIRAGFLGTFVGVLPGAGATMASFLSYLTEKRISKNSANFGKGAPEGVAAAESANNAAAAGAFAPLLALGIPGSGTTAVLLGGLMMWGLKPGPLLFKENPDFVWGLIGSMYIGNVICLIIAIACIPLMAKVVNVPSSVMVPIISSVCIVGTYSVNNSMFDVGLMICAGGLAYLMQVAKIPDAPLLLSFVLTPMLEMYVRQAFDMSGGKLDAFVASKISIVLILLIIAFSVSPAFMKLIKKNKKTVSNSDSI